MNMSSVAVLQCVTQRRLPRASISGCCMRTATRLCLTFLCLVVAYPRKTTISAKIVAEEFLYIADPVTEALEYVEAIERQRHNCSFGPTLNLEYLKKRWTYEAMVTVRAANLLTFFARSGGHILGTHPDDVNILYSLVRANVNNYEKVFGSAIAFDIDLYRDYDIFCPYAFISPDGVVIAKDLSIGYDYHDNGTDWFWVPFEKFNNFGYNEPSLNITERNINPNSRHRLLTIEDGYWTQPYFDCGGGDVWMVTFSMPFFTSAGRFDSSPEANNSSQEADGNIEDDYVFAGVTTIDVVLDNLDINQCPRDVNADDSNVFDPFVNTHKCRNTTKCVQLRNQGFKRGTYQCQCVTGYYFPDVHSGQNAFNGTSVEEEYSKAIRELPNAYESFVCLPCAEGCDDCVDSRPCFLKQNGVLRLSIASLQCVLILGLLGLGIYTFIMKEHKVIKAASPGLLYVFLFGAAITYSQVLVDALFASNFACSFTPWSKYIGFSLAYGALLFKTWRITVVFKVRSAKPVRITDNNLYLRIAILVGAVAIGLGAWTLLGTPESIIALTKGGMKYYSCSKTYRTYIGEAGELLFLAWGVYLCVKVRKAPSAFNEAKYISVCIYNKTLMSFFSLVLISFVLPTLEGGADIYIVVEFTRIHISMTMIVGLLFGSKMYHVYHFDESEGIHTQTALKQPVGPAGGTTMAKNKSKLLAEHGPGPMTINTVDSGGPAARDLALSNSDVQAEIDRMKAMIQNIQDSMQLSDAEMKTIIRSAELTIKYDKPPKQSLVNVVQEAQAQRMSKTVAQSQSITSGSSSNIFDSSKPGQSNEI